MGSDGSRSPGAAACAGRARNLAARRLSGLARSGRGRTLLRAMFGLMAVFLASLAVLAWLGTRDVPQASGGRSAGPAATRPTAGGAGEAGGAPAAADPSTLVARGAYLTRIGNCLGCHTQPGGAPYAGGGPLATPFGTFYGPNITPAVAAGIGNWSANDFWNALHNGKGRDGQLLYPVFPYPQYTHVTRDDADAMFAYLRTITPVEQPSRPHELAFPYRLRPLLALWRGVYFRPAAPAALEAGNPSSSTPAEAWRGRYLVEGLGHCAACHSARNAWGATASPGSYGGGLIPGLDWYAPPLDGNPVHGLGAWSDADIVQLLRTGMSARGTAAGPMAEVVAASTQYLTPADAQAIAAYLKTVPAPSGDTRPSAAAPDAALMQRGRELYGNQCAQCHQEDGKGHALAWPALAGNSSVTAPAARNAIRVVLEGGFAPVTAANPQPHGMPPFGQSLDDADVAAVVTYIRNSWGNAAGAVSALQVKQVRNGTALR